MTPWSNTRTGYGVGFVFILCCMAGLFFWKHHHLSQARLTSQIRFAVQEAVKDPTQTFRMSDLTDFPWEELYVFGPYTSPEYIEKILGFPYPAAEDSGMAYSDAFCLLVFTHDQRVIRSIDYARGDGDFCSLSEAGKINREAAVFSVAQSTDGLLIVTLKNGAAEASDTSAPTG